MKSNILVKAGALFMVLLVMLVVMKKSGTRDHEQDAPLPVGGGEAVSEETLAALGLEGDTEADTVRTLVGEVRKLKQDIGELRQDNQDLRSDNASLLKMEEAIARRVSNEVSQAAEQQERWTQRRLQELSHQADNKYEQLVGRFQKSGSGVPASGGASLDASGTVWLPSLDAQAASTGISHPLDLLSSKVGNQDRLGIDQLPGTRGRKRDEGEIKPLYTVPKNATLVGSTAFTALVGRVPVGSNVVDPYSFKVIIGKDNLAANGIEVPEVAHAVASGKAVGDWTLGCVRGELHSITFVFNDGTIRTIPRPKDIYEGGNRTKETPIGELADNFGNPCVVGRRITNAYSYLAQRIGVSATAAAAEAAAASETTTLTSTGGGGIGVSTVVDGSKSDFILGRTLADGAQEVADWLDQRQSQHFDAIYVPPGETVAIHIIEELRIDYDTQGRKTHHTELAYGGNYRELD